MNAREFAIEVVTKLQSAGFQALWAGGCVRDELLGLTPADYDVATNAEPHQLAALFKRRNEIGAHFGVVQVIGPRGNDGEWLTVEVATFRLDGPYDPGGRIPGWVKFCSPEEDARRRDFTINGMFFNPLTGELIDYVGGRDDLAAKRLRAIGHPIERFTEDKLRILRAVRMASRFDLAIESETFAAARHMAPGIGIVSAERIADELRKMLTHHSRARAVALLDEFDLVKPILPELWPSLESKSWCLIVKRVEALNSAAGSGSSISFPLVMAAMLLQLGRKTSDAISDRLRLSNVEKTRIGWLVENHTILLEAHAMRRSRLFPVLVHAGIQELLTLHRAQVLAAGLPTDGIDYCERLLRETPRDVLDPSPVLTGDDLIAQGLKPGKEFKRLLDAVREAQLEGQVCAKEDGLALVQRLRSPSR